jgi:hypothetical protein
VSDEGKAAEVMWLRANVTGPDQAVWALRITAKDRYSLVIKISGFILLHGNEREGPDDVRRLVDRCRMSSAYLGEPIVLNENDHTDSDAPDNHLLAAIGRHASWGFFDYRRKGEDFGAGCATIPSWRGREA